MKLTTLSALAILTITTCFGQNKQDIKLAGITKKGDIQLLKHAFLQFDKKSYYAATYDLETLAESYQENEMILFLLGKSYYLSRDYKRANKIYSELIELFPDTKYTIAYFQYAESLKYTGDYMQAAMLYSKFRRTKSHNKEEKKAKQWARNSKQSCQFALKASIEDSVPVAISILSEEINSSYTDFSPIQLSENELMFSSLRKDDIQYYKHKTSNDQKVNFFITELEDEHWSSPKIVDALSDDFDHVANGNFGPDNYFYYTKCLTDFHHDITCNLYRTKYERGIFSSKSEKLKKVNKPGYSSTQPCFAKHKKRSGRTYTEVDVMYFSTNRPGSVGKMDIWYSVYKNGKFEQPINCGKKVNSIRDEVTPFYDLKAKKLFFSSNYHKGLGGFDVFSCKGLFGKFKPAQNLGIPVNSSYDDTYYSFRNDNGFVVSNRPGGFALTSESCCDDIYTIKTTKIDSNSLKVLTSTVYEDIVLASLNKQEISKIPLTDTRIGLIRDYVKKTLDNRLGEASLVSYWEYSSVEGLTDQNGLIKLDFPSNEYMLLVSKDGYNDTILPVGNLSEIEILMTPKKQNEPEEKPIQDLEKNGEVIMNNIQFASNSANVKHSSISSLEQLFNFLKSNPTISLEVSGHTDNIGTTEENYSLSIERANSIKAFLTNKGILSKRIKIKGYGESKPIASNETKDGKKKNRRVQIKVINK